MGFGVDGHKCKKCGLNFNSAWNSVTMDFWDGKCPECSSTEHESLPAPIEGEWHHGEVPDYVYADQPEIRFSPLPPRVQSR